MSTAFQQIDRAKEELADIRVELMELQKHIDRLGESLQKSVAELFGSNYQTLSHLDEAALAAKIAQIVQSRIAVASPNPVPRKHYVLVV